MDCEGKQELVLANENDFFFQQDESQNVQETLERELAENGKPPLVNEVVFAESWVQLEAQLLTGNQFDFIFFVHFQVPVFELAGQLPVILFDS